MDQEKYLVGETLQCKSSYQRPTNWQPKKYLRMEWKRPTNQMGKRVILSRLNPLIDYTLRIYHCHFQKIVTIDTKKCNLSKILDKCISGYMHHFLPRKTTLYHLVTIISWEWSITSCQFLFPEFMQVGPLPCVPNCAPKEPSWFVYEYGTHQGEE